MNPKYRLSFFIVTMLVVVACNKKLDIAPEGVMTEEGALTAKSTAEDMLAGAYHQMFLSMNGDAYALGDLTTGIAQTSSNNWFTGAVTPDDNTVSTTWNNSYAAINLANVIITKLRKYANFDIATQNQFVAEARFIRAFCYLNLLKLYGDGALENKPNNMGVPLRLTSFDGYDGSQLVPRATNGEVYAQIKLDLDSAMAVLPVNYTQLPNQYCRATSVSAAALAARVAFYMHDYQACNDYCNVVLSDSAHHVLAASPVDVFPDNINGDSKDYAFNKEILFAFPVSYNDDPTQYAKHNVYYSYGYVYPDSAFVASYAAYDLRKTVMIDTIDNYGTQLPITIKFSDPDLKDNVVMLRLAEVMLTKAEALAFINGVNDSSVYFLNKIHQRAFVSSNAPSVYLTTDFASKEELVNQILQEKKWELAFEGLDRYDEIAAGRKPNSMLPTNKYALPIPQYDVDISNGVIKQNSAYIK